MKEHLDNLANILAKAIKPYKFISAYLSITGVVQHNVVSRLHISCNNEFDDLTVREVMNIESSVYEKLRDYLVKNKIEKSLIIRDAPKQSWANNGVELVFEESKTLNIY